MWESDVSVMEGVIAGWSEIFELSSEDSSSYYIDDDYYYRQDLPHAYTCSIHIHTVYIYIYLFVRVGLRMYKIFQINIM